MKLERISIAFLMVLLTLAILPSSQAAMGPREDELQMRFYSNVLNAYTALETGEIDIVGFDIQEPVYIDAIDNPNVALGAVDDMGMYELDLNNNYTIGSFPGWRSPTNYLEMRQAIAFVTDKDLVVDTYCGGFAARLDQPIAYPTQGWMNASYTGANYPYEYDP
jgi:ABC-type transport system substrate-binding protein